MTAAEPVPPNCSAKFYATIGARSSLRNFLNTARFQDSRITWIENKGWFQSMFVVRAPSDVLLRIGKQIGAWGSALDNT